MSFDKSGMGSCEFAFEESSITCQKGNRRTGREPEDLAELVELFFREVNCFRRWIGDASDEAAGKTPQRTSRAETQSSSSTVCLTWKPA